MELQAKSYLIIITALAIIIILFTYLNIQQEKPITRVDIEELGTCRSLVYNGEDRIDLLFLASEEDTKRFSDTILNTPPYDENKDYFNVFFIPPSDYTPTCEDYKGIAILCSTKENLEAARRCPNDYIIIVKDYPTNIRSSAFSNVVSINKNHENSVIIHEFGHAFGNLAEEYVPANLPRGAKNCVSSCDKFNAPTDSCDLECSKTNFFRSIRAGVMRTLTTSDYGQYNIHLLKKLLEKNSPSEPAITGNQISEYAGCENEQVVIVEGTQSTDGSISLDKPTKILQGCSPDNSGAGVETITTASGQESYSVTTMFTDVQSGETLTGSLESPANIVFSTAFTSNKDEIILTDTETGAILSQTTLAQAGATACIV
ncbi:MAG: M64 family metallopeptidase [Nanoarchaeota archaeon]